MFRLMIACLSLLTLGACGTRDRAIIAPKAATQVESQRPTAELESGVFLSNVRWSFAEPLPKSPEALIEAARAYAKANNAPDPGDSLRSLLPFSVIYIRYHRITQAPDGARLAANVSQKVAAAKYANLTGAELLWEIHRGCGSGDRCTDLQHFKGLVLMGDGSDGFPAEAYVRQGH